MTIDMVKFTAEVAKGISVGTKEVTIKLLIPLAAVESMLSSLAKMQEKEVMVYLGDPQAAFDFDDEDRDPMYNPWNGGRRVTTDASGVVTRIEGQGEERDENQAELFNSEGSSPDQQEANGDGAEQNGEGSETPQEGEGERISEEGAGEPPTDDLPDWMKEGENYSGSKEMDFSFEGEQQPPADLPKNENVSPPAGDKKVASSEISKEELEQFILAQRPIFEDIKLADTPADFPALLQQRNDGKTWMEISKEINVPSGQISSKYGAYKKRVTKMMQDGVAV